MSIQVQIRRGTTLENDTFTGAQGEITYDTTTKSLRLHDGLNPGGVSVPSLVFVQRPTAENNYTFVRKWSDGWVEQGGVVAIGTSATSIALPVRMADAYYYASATPYAQSTARYISMINTSSATTVVFLASENLTNCRWRVEGYAA